MNAVTIRFLSEAANTRGFYELIQITRVVCLPHDTYQIPLSALRFLEEKGLKYEVLKNKGLERVQETVRNSPASKV